VIFRVYTYTLVLSSVARPRGRFYNENIVVPLETNDEDMC